MRGISLKPIVPSISSQHRSAGHDLPVMNASQLGGIETSVLDNGPGRGVRIAWVNTAGGLRYKVVIDRGLDIADAEFFGQSLTWHSPTGVTAPTRAFDQGYDWLRSFYGGLLVGCGPLNTGNAFTEEGKPYGLHGTHSNTPATVESIVNPDLMRGSHEMQITGKVQTASVFGATIELKRTISSRLGVPSIHVSDSFLNRGNQRVPFCWLLHINVGYPLLEPGASTYCWRGKESPLEGSESWYAPGNDFKTAPQPMEAHRGAGEFCAYIDPEVGTDGNVLAGIVNRSRQMALKIEFSLKDYPRLVNWQHWGPAGSYAGAIEPSNAGVEGRPLDAERGWLQYLEPGETRTLQCTLTATNSEADFQQLLALNDAGA
jgi:hypothetical protein